MVGRGPPYVMLLALDVGSSSVKAALLDGTRVVAHATSPYGTDYGGDRAEVPVQRIEAAIRLAVAELDASEAIAVGVTGMGPAWLAMDADGHAITPVVTHQDRRSLPQAKRIERTVGRKRHLDLAGNRPTPGGISSTTAAWFAAETDVIGRAFMLGHLPTYLLHKLTGAWSIDPSNAGFSGLMDVTTGDWSDELCAAANVPRDKLPPIRDAADVLGEISKPNPESAKGSASGLRRGATRDNDLNIPPNLPAFGGYVDGSGAILVAGATPGRLVHSAGSTDVLALCLDRPMPRDGLLCRPLGTGGLWVSAATCASGGSSLDWLKKLLFAEVDYASFDEKIRAAADAAPPAERFRPYLAGDRQRVTQPSARFAGLTLSTGRDELLAGVVHSLIADNLDRLGRLLQLADDAGVTVDRNVTQTGGAAALADAMHARWPGDWSFADAPDATLRGLGALHDASRSPTGD